MQAYFSSRKYADISQTTRSRPRANFRRLYLLSLSGNENNFIRYQCETLIQKEEYENYFKYIFSVALGSIMLTSCDLDTIPTTYVDAGSVFGKTGDAEKYLMVVGTT